MSVVPKFVGAVEIRKLFNDGDYFARAAAGEFTKTIVRRNHPSPPLAKEPHCTHSELVAYMDKYGQEIARVHRYLRPDNSIGLSGQEDPKQLWHNGVLLSVAAN